MREMIIMLLDWFYEADPQRSDSVASQDLHTYMFNELAKLALDPYDNNLREMWREWKLEQ